MATTAAAPVPSLSFSERYLAPYRRVTSSGQFIPEIDGFRFIAIFFVFIYHLAGDVLRNSPPDYVAALPPNPLFAVTQVLDIGVPIFFVISGFILGMPFAVAHLRQQRPVPLKKYFLRRVTRLEPPYILSLLLFFVLKIAWAKGSAASIFPNLLASLFYAHNIIYRTPSAINFVAWSLEIEIQFYILAPLIALLFAVRRPYLRRLMLGALILVATGIGSLASEAGSARLSILGYGQFFLAGFLLVELYIAGGERWRRNPRWDLVSLAGWPVLLGSLVLGGPVTYWVLPWIIALLTIAGYHGVVMNRFVGNLWIATAGGMCYTIYLLHNYIVAGLGAHTERFLHGYPFDIRLLVQLLLIAPVVLLVSALYFRFIERPCMDQAWPRKLARTIAGFSSAEGLVAR